MSLYPPAVRSLLQRWFTRRRDATDRAARADRAHALLDQGNVAAALAEFSALDAADGITGTTEIFEQRRLDIERAQRGEPHFRWLEDVRIDTAYWTVMREGGVYNDDVHAKNLATSPFVRGRVSHDGSRIVATLPPPSQAVNEECVLVGGDDNYSHWLFRNILKLSTLDRAGLLYSFPWLVNADLKGYQSEYISLLGQSSGQLIKVERNAVIECRRLLVPALHISTRAISEGVQWIRGRLAHLLADRQRATRRLFVSRRDSARRSVVNEDDIFAELAPLAFERIVPGEMSVVDQIKSFSEARCIVAAHGAALTNMIFAPPGAAIVEITSSAIEHMNLFRKIARSTEQPIATIVSNDYPGASGRIDVNTDYRADARAVVAAAQTFIAN